MDEQTPAEKVLLKANPAWLERAIGLVAMAVAIVLALGTYAFALELLKSANPLSPGAVGPFATFLLLTMLFVVAGHRLVFQEPNQHGSLFAPWVWFTISAAILITTLVTAAAGFRRDKAETAYAVLCALFLALLAYGAGAHFRRKEKERRNAA